MKRRAKGRREGDGKGRRERGNDGGGTCRREGGLKGKIKEAYGGKDRGRI